MEFGHGMMGGNVEFGHGMMGGNVEFGQSGRPAFSGQVVAPVSGQVLVAGRGSLTANSLLGSATFRGGAGVGGFQNPYQGQGVHHPRHQTGLAPPRLVPGMVPPAGVALAVGSWRTFLAYGLFWHIGRFFGILDEKNRHIGRFFGILDETQSRSIGIRALACCRFGILDET